MRGIRVLLSTIGSRGDVQPLVALALELRALGATVRMCAPPDFGEWIGGMGIAFTPIGPELRALPVAPAQAPPNVNRLRALAEGSVAAQFQAIGEAARGCDVIVAATALQIAARSVAEINAAHYVFVAYTPVVLPSERHAPPPHPLATPAPAQEDNAELWRRDATRFNEMFGAALNGSRLWRTTWTASSKERVGYTSEWHV